jgi:hypothetical protein
LLRTEQEKSIKIREQHEINQKNDADDEEIGKVTYAKIKEGTSHKM